MKIARINKSVLRVVQLQKDNAGNVVPVVLYKKSGGKKKMSGPLRPVEKAIRRLATAQQSFADTYVDKHHRSNRKNKDGWVRDIVPNIVDAGKNGRKKLRVNRLIMG